MRLSVQFKPDEIPVGYHMMFVSLIKEALNKVDQDYYDELYNYDEDKVNKQSKDFCFGVFMKGFRKERDVFKIEDRVVLNLSSPDYNFGINLYNGLLKIDDFTYDDFEMKKIRVDLVKEKEIKEEEIEFSTLSPICIKDKNNQFLDVDDENYVKELNYIVDLTLKNYRGYGLKKELDFEYDSKEFTKVVVKQKIKKFTENTGRPYYYVNSYQGRFKLKGDIEDLNDIYQLGVGFKRNQGFGMVEVIT